MALYRVQFDAIVNPLQSDLVKKHYYYSIAIKDALVDKLKELPFDLKQKTKLDLPVDEIICDFAIIDQKELTDLMIGFRTLKYLDTVNSNISNADVIKQIAELIFGPDYESILK